jgi:hypothetical protein
MQDASPPFTCGGQRETFRLRSSRSFDETTGSANKESTAMDRFVHIQNLARFQRLLARTTDEAERRRVLKLLTEEEAKGPKIDRPG